MNDELRKLEERIASLERKVRLLYTAIGGEAGQTFHRSRWWNVGGRGLV